MKTPKIKIVFLIAIMALCVLTSLAGILICESKLPYMTKYSFSMFLIIGLCVLLVLMSNAYERITEHLNGDLLKKKNEALKESEQNLKSLRTQVDELKEKVSTGSVGRQEEMPESNTEFLRKKCETIENFRNSFPYRIDDGYILYNIMRIEIQVSGFSRWQLVGEFEGQLWEYTLLRPDTQSYKEMLSLAAATTEPAELKELNISEQLLWN